MKRNKVLILVPDLNKSGGVANYYRSIRRFLLFNYEFFTRGSRQKKGKFFNILYSILDYFIFTKNVLFQNVDLVLLNHSLCKSSFYRDLIFIKILQICNIKYIIFFRGWNTKFAHEILNKSIFKKSFLEAEKIIVLANQFRDQLTMNGFKGKIVVETTTVNEDLLKDLNNRKKYKNLLFLSRITEDKGVLNLIKAYEILKKEDETFKLTIAGDGDFLKTCKSYVLKNDIKDINFTGYISGKDKIEILSNSGVFIFPSVYGEGMPNAVLEALSFGLNVITTKVGGLADFFEEKKMGLFLDNNSVEEIILKTKQLSANKELMKSITEYNITYAKKFYSSNVAKRLVALIEEERVNNDR